MSVLGWLGIYLLQINNLIPPPLIVYEIDMIWALKGLVFMMAAILLYLATKSISDAYKLVQKERDSLEVIVDDRTKKLIEANKNLKEQQNALIRAEQERVMLESIGAALHHITQPLTSMMIAIETLMRSDELSELKKNELIGLYRKNANKINSIMDKFLTLKQYQTIEYATGKSIIDIERSSL